MKNHPLVLSVEEAAEQLGIGRNSAYDAIHRGQIPSFRIGNSIRIPRIPFEKLLKERQEAMMTQSTDQDQKSAPIVQLGRPRQEPSIVVNLRLPVSISEKLRISAEQNCRSLSSEIRWHLIKSIRENSVNHD